MVCNVSWDTHAWQWRVICMDGTVAESDHPTRDEAVFAGRRYAHKNRPSVLRVHRRDGTLEAEFPYP